MPSHPLENGEQNLQKGTFGKAALNTRTIYLFYQIFG